jgi:holo-[acyl-carrier protein] synthase
MSVILGIGADLCQIHRIRRSVSRFGDAWIGEMFTPKERNCCLATSDPGLSFARGFCCKEACAKALGTGFAKRVDPRDIELSAENSGITVVLHGHARSRLRRLTPRGHKPQFLVASSHNHLFASSIAILQADPTS